MLNYLNTSQRMAEQGKPLTELAGPYHVVYNDIAVEGSKVKAHPLSKLFIDILKTFPDLHKTSAKVATIHVMHAIMRWQVHPTLENYRRMPPWVSPRPPALLIPHPHWLDHIPW